MMMERSSTPPSFQCLTTSTTTHPIVTPATHPAIASVDIIIVVGIAGFLEFKIITFFILSLTLYNYHPLGEEGRSTNNRGEVESS